MAVYHLIPGAGFVNETVTAKHLVPGAGFVNESLAAAGGTTVAPFIWHYKQQGMMSILFALVFLQYLIDGLSNANLS